MFKIVSSNQFRKDLKLAQKRGLPIDKLRDVVNTLAAGKNLMINIETIILPGITADSVNAILSLTGYWYIE